MFPYIVRMEEAVIQNEPVLPPPFGSVQNPVSMMEHEHDSAGNALRAMREASSGYTTPPDGCISYHTLYQALAEFEVRPPPAHSSGKQHSVSASDRDGEGS